MASNKGSNFERTICKKLSEWWSNNERDDIFWRSDSSGGRAKIRKQQGKNTYANHGDIKPIDPFGSYLTNILCIELKTGYGKFSFLDLIDKPPMRKGQKNETLQPLEKFIKQVEEDAIATNTFPVIIFKRDKRTAMITLPHSFYLEMKRWHKNTPKGPALFLFRHKHSNYSYVAFNLDNFLNWANPDYFYYAKANKEWA